MDDYLVIGLIKGVHGVRGRLRVMPLTDEPERFKQLANCLVRTGKKGLAEYELEDVSFHGQQVLLKLAGIDSKEKGQELYNCEIVVERSAAIELDQDSWFVPDLLGCSVCDGARGDLGSLVDIMLFPHHDIYIVRQKGEKDLLIPALKTIVKEIDIAAKKIDVDLPAGLFEIYRDEEE